MKTFIVLVAVAVAVCAQAFTDEQVEKLKQYHKECSVESGVDQEAVANARKGQFAEDPKLKAHIFCVSKKIGFQNEAGDIQSDVLRAKVNSVLENEELTQKLIEQCALKKATPEDTAFDTVKCYYENTPQHLVIA